VSDRAPRQRAVLQLRLVVEAQDYGAVAFYRDVLGLPQQAAFEGDGEARVTILDAGRATLEIANPAQKRSSELRRRCNGWTITACMFKGLRGSGRVPIGGPRR
jgi:hypothetical protein